MRFGWCVLVFLIFMTFTIESKPYYVDPVHISEMKHYRNLLIEHPSSADVKFELAMRYAYSGFIQEGWDLLKELPDDYSDHVISKYDSIVNSQPNEWKPRFKLAFGYYFKDQPDQSIELFKSILKIHPNHPWTMAFMALVEGLEKTGKEASESAIFWCKKALEQEPNATAVHLLIAEAYRRNGDVWVGMGHLMKAGQLLTKEKLSDEFLEN